MDYKSLKDLPSIDTQGENLDIIREIISNSLNNPFYTVPAGYIRYSSYDEHTDDKDSDSGESDASYNLIIEGDTPTIIMKTSYQQNASLYFFLSKEKSLKTKHLILVFKYIDKKWFLIPYIFEMSEGKILKKTPVSLLTKVNMQNKYSPNVLAAFFKTLQKNIIFNILESEKINLNNKIDLITVYHDNVVSVKQSVGYNNPLENHLINYEKVLKNKLENNNINSILKNLSS